MRWIARLSPKPHHGLRVNSLSTMVQACRAGVGMALLPCIMGDDTGLTRLSKETEVCRELWLLSHKDAGSIGRFKLVASWLTQLYNENQRKLCG
jgi:DNA-binding transcriptional LysR family regulator